ncbi:MAG: glycosyltransferase [Desulfomonilaceae bacterium]|nr:glycosyltransferase [Desulfomonilaceae bacterium]
MDQHLIKRILVYTHNSIGLGHAFRTLAVITGMKKWRPDIDFLVISGTSIPQIFFEEGIEVIKLPSIKLDIDRDDSPMLSRYLTGFDLESIFDFRQTVIMASFNFFQPDALIIEHNMTGQMSELIPLLMKKWVRKGGPVDFPLVHVCRGIMKWVPLLRIPYQNPRHRSESINIGALYDFMYVLEDREVIDINKAFLGDDPELEKKIRYLGKVTNRVHGEFPPRKEVLNRFGLPDRGIVLLSLGRNGKVFDLTVKLMEVMNESRADRDRQVVMVLDPYLEESVSEAIRSHPLCEHVRFLEFFPDMVDLVNESEAVISRAGYNTVNEILLTGVKALLIPESHGGGEQEQRAKSIEAEHVCILNEDEVLNGTSGERILEFMDKKITSVPRRFDKYEVGKIIIDDLENWKTHAIRRKENCSAH